MPTWQSFTELPEESLSIVHPLHLLNALLAELHRTHSEISSAIVFSHTQPCLQGIHQPGGLPPEFMNSAVCQLSMCLSESTEFRSAFVH
jgi:hypothetical protein